MPPQSILSSDNSVTIAQAPNESPLNQRTSESNSDVNTPRTKLRRSNNAMSPKPILDRDLLTNALKKVNIHLKANQLESFYQQLHRQNYPSLSEFVQNYYANQARDTSTPTKMRTTKGQKNLLQLPKAFLNFLDNKHSLVDDDDDGVLDEKINTPEFATLTSHVSHAATSADGSTTKLAVTLQSDNNGGNEESFTVETVIMRHAGSRITLCVSSQVGCAMGCTFCATGTMGIRGNLTSGEILEQIVHAEKILQKEASQKDEKAGNKNNKFEGVRNVVFMGMGEPLNNYKNVVAACEGLMDRRRWNLAHGRVTVSTVGVTPKMKLLTRDLPQVNLALSLHAPNQELRTQIVPTAKQYPIEGMIEALDGHMRGGDGNIENNQKRKKAMIEYVMLNGPTSTFKAAHQLGKLCENRKLVVNLIPYNQTNVKDKLTCPSESHMKQFQDIVTSYGVFCFIRRTMGADIAGACGQLVVEKEQEKNMDVDIEDVVMAKGVNSGKSEKRKVVSTSHGEQKVASAVPLKTGSNDRSTSEKKKKVVVVVDDNHHKKEKLSFDMEKWIMPLTAATAIAATSLIVSSTLLAFQRYRR